MKPKKRRSAARVFDSMAQAAAIMGVDVDSLKSAKAAGAPGFKGSRIYWADYARWQNARDREHAATLRMLAAIRKYRAEHPEA